MGKTFHVQCYQCEVCSLMMYLQKQMKMLYLGLFITIK